MSLFRLLTRLFVCFRKLGIFSFGFLCNKSQFYQWRAQKERERVRGYCVSICKNSRQTFRHTVKSERKQIFMSDAC